MEPIEGAAFTPKGWGWERTIVNTPKYCGKVLVFAMGRKCSWHYHALDGKDETFLVIRGALHVTYGPDDDPDSTRNTYVVLRAGRSLRIEPGTRHRMLALEDTEMVEFSTHDEPADSIKIERGDTI